MKRMKRIRYLLGSTAVLFLVLLLAGPLTAVEKKKVRMVSPTNTLPDLTVERVWLDKECAISLSLSNTGQGALTRKDHRSGEVTISYGKKRTSIPLSQADPKKILLKPGGKVTFVSNLNLKDNQRVQVTTDSQNRIKESSESNNSKATLLKPNCSLKFSDSNKAQHTKKRTAAEPMQTYAKTSPTMVEPQKLPDLVITKVSLNNECRIVIALENKGPGKVPASLYSTAKINITYNRKKTSYSFAQMDPGRKLVRPGSSTRFTTPLRLVESYSVKAIVDAHDSIKESNEQNNTGRPILLKPDCAPVAAARLNPAPLNLKKQTPSAATALSIHKQGSPGGSQSPQPNPGPGPGPPLPGSVTVTHPSSSLNLREAESYLIRWEYQSLPANTCVSLSLFQGSMQKEMITPSTCGTSYNWSVPGYPYMTNYKIRAMVIGQPPGSAIFDDSDQFSMLQQAPDLFASNIYTTPNEPTTSDTITYEAIINNFGSQSPRTNSAVLEIQGPGGYSQTYNYSFSPLEPSTLSSFFRIEQPLQGLAPGSYLAGLRVFSTVWGASGTKESYWSHQFWVIGVPDLVTCIPSNWYVKTTVTRSIPIYVKNIGTAPSAATDFTFYLEQTGLYTYPVPQLAPGNDYQIPFPGRKYWIIGNLDMIGNVDPGNNINESEEGNNKRCGTLKKRIGTFYNISGFPNCSNVSPCSTTIPVVGGN